MENEPDPRTPSAAIRPKAMIRWSLITLLTAASAYLFFNIQLSMWVFPVQHSVDEEKLMFERLQKAEASYASALQLSSNDLQRNTFLLRANYEASSAIVEKLILIDRSQTSLRQELATSFRGLSFALCAIFVVLTLGLLERLTRFSKLARDN